MNNQEIGIREVDELASLLPKDYCPNLDPYKRIQTFILEQLNKNNHELGVHDMFGILKKR